MLLNDWQNVHVLLELQRDLGSLYLGGTRSQQDQWQPDPNLKAANLIYTKIEVYCRFQVTSQKCIPKFVTNVRVYVLIVRTLGRAWWSKFDTFGTIY